jgi:ribosomal protein L12E/L44/L45/RPP1/RPP2
LLRKTHRKANNDVLRKYRALWASQRQGACLACARQGVQNCQEKKEEEEEGEEEEEEEQKGKERI